MRVNNTESESKSKMEPAITNRNFVVRSISMHKDQLARVSEVVDLSRLGQFSQFVQDAIEEKLKRMEGANDGSGTTNHSQAVR